MNMDDINIKTEGIEAFKRMLENNKLQRQELEAQLRRVVAKIEVIQEMIDQANKCVKFPTNEEIIQYAKKLIVEKGEHMKKTTSIVKALEADGYEIDGPEIRPILLRSGQFQINEETKIWQYIGEDCTQYNN